MVFLEYEVEFDLSVFVVTNALPLLSEVNVTDPAWVLDIEFPLESLSIL